MVHGGWGMGRGVGLFGQLAGALEQGRTGGPRPTDGDTLPLHQAFLEGAQTTGAGRFWGRVGRQELFRGGPRAVPPRPPSEVPRALAAVRAARSGRAGALRAVMVRAGAA